MSLKEMKRELRNKQAELDHLPSFIDHINDEYDYETIELAASLFIDISNLESEIEDNEI